MARVGWTTAAVSVGCILAYGCASRDSSKGAGSETHFVCERDRDCPSERPHCVEEECSATPATCSASSCTDAQAPESDASTWNEAGRAPDGSTACGEQPPAQFSCVQFCGTDRPHRPLECRGGTWQCPEDTPVRFDQCPEDTCPDENPDCSAACTPPANEVGSMEVSFRFTNDSDAPVGLWNSCVIAHRITGCADGFQDPLLTWVFCSPTCPADGCPVCGGCADSLFPITSEMTTELDWAGTTIRLNEDGAPPGCACAERNEVSPGTYRITVPVFSTAPQPMPNSGSLYRTPIYEVTTEFTLPDEDGIIEVPIDDSPHFGPCAGPGVCVLWQDPDLGTTCQLETPASDLCPVWAPRQFRCDEPIPLASTCIDPSNEVPGFEPTDGVIRCCPE